MSTIIRALLATLVGLLAFSGVAAAQNSSCPECDEDGASNPTNSYHSVDLGVVNDSYEALGDTDVAFDEETADRGFFGWISICLSAFLEKVGGIVGLDADANAEVYVEEDGVDVDATARLDGKKLVDFDESPVGHLDGKTWAHMKAVGNATRSVDRPDLPHVQDTDLDVCVHAEVRLATCG